MNNKIFLTAIFLFGFFTLKAQGSYAGFNATYGMPVAGNVLGVISSENLNTNVSSYENVNGSYGSGFNVGSYFGYMINENMGFDIGINYLWGSKYKFSDYTDYGFGNTNDIINEISASSFRISPAVRFGFGNGKFRPFLRGGMTFGLFNKIIDNTTETLVGVGSTDITLKKFEMIKGISIGFMGAFGINYAVNDKVSLFAEMTNYLISWAPGKGELVKATVNGTDQMPFLNVSDKQFEYVDKLDRSGNTDPNSPTVSLKTYFPMSSFGISLGMHFEF